MSGRSRDTLRSSSRALPLTPPLQSFGCGPYRLAWGVSRFAASGVNYAVMHEDVNHYCMSQDKKRQSPLHDSLPSA